MLSLAGPGLAGAPIKFPDYRVTVRVQSKDEELKKTVESHLRRELRALRDVRLVSPKEVANEAFYTVELVCVNAVVEGQPVGYAFSVLFLSDYGSNYVQGSWVSRVVCSHDLPILASHISDRAKVHFHGLYVFPAQDVSQMCAEMANEFDALVLSPDRATRQSIQELWIPPDTPPPAKPKKE